MFTNMFAKAQTGIGFVLLSLAFFGVGCAYGSPKNPGADAMQALFNPQKTESKSAQGEGIGELKTEWRTNWEKTPVRNGRLFNLSFINHEQIVLTDCRISLDDTTNDIKDLLFRVSFSGNANYFSTKIDKIEPEVIYEIGDNMKSSSFASGSNRPNLDQPLKKVKLECMGKTSEWQINYQ